MALNQRASCDDSARCRHSSASSLAFLSLCQTSIVAAHCLHPFRYTLAPLTHRFVARSSSSSYTLQLRLGHPLALPLLPLAASFIPKAARLLPLRQPALEAPREGLKAAKSGGEGGWREAELPAPKPNVTWWHSPTVGERHWASTQTRDGAALVGPFTEQV